jgi:hypothetical protein
LAGRRGSRHCAVLMTSAVGGGRFRSKCW